MFFAPTARCVTLVVRGHSLARSTSHYLIQQIAELPNVHVRTGAEVVGASGGDHLERLKIFDRTTGDEEEVEASWLFVFVFVGAAPCTDWLGKEVVRDENGFVLTGPDLLADGQLRADWPLERQPYFLQSSVPGVFAAGDVRGQSGGIGRRRGGHGGHARPPVAGAAVSALKEELHSNLLFESVTDEQLEWLVQHGIVETHDAGVHCVPPR